MTSALAACSLAPTYHPPETPAPVAFKESGPWVTAVPGSAAMSADWWTGFGDTTLDGLEQRVQTGNPTLAGALGRYDEARGYLQQIDADALPTAGTNAQVTSDRQSNHRPLRGGGEPDFYAADTVSGNIGYELDLWGRVRNSVAAGRGQAQASADDIAAIRLSLESQVAMDFIALQGDDRQIDLLSDTVDAYVRAAKLTQRRFATGIASGIDTGESQTLLAEARAQLADTRKARALTEHAIASLVGTPASSFSLAPDTADLVVPVVPVGVPSTLLQRRPDIAAAERRMYAANRGIGVAKAAFYPQISLLGMGGVQNTALAGLFGAGNLIWSVGPSVSFNLFDGGKRRGQLAVARAGWETATAAYREDVLKAFQEVEDALAQTHYLQDQLAAEREAQDQATQVGRLSLNNYTKGALDYLQVVTAQTTALRVRRSVIDLRTQSLQATVKLIQAIGGDWRPDPHAPNPPQQGL